MQEGIYTTQQNPDIPAQIFFVRGNDVYDKDGDYVDSPSEFFQGIDSIQKV